MKQKIFLTILICTIASLVIQSTCVAQHTAKYSGDQQKFYKECITQRNTSQVFDCDCLAQKYAVTVNAMMANKKQPRKATAKDIRILQMACNGKKTVYIKGSGVRLYPKSRNEKQRQFYLKKFGEPQHACDLLKKAKAGESIAPAPKIVSPPSVNQMWMQLGNDVECRDLDKIYNHYYQQAKGYHKSNLYSTSKSEQDFCECYATVFKEGLKTGIIGSRLYTQLGTKALQKCK